jgi:hypothetical protein
MYTQVRIEEAQRQAQHLGLALLAVPLSRHAGVLRARHELELLATELQQTPATEQSSVAALPQVRYMLGANSSYLASRVHA